MLFDLLIKLLCTDQCIQKFKLVIEEIYRQFTYSLILQYIDNSPHVCSCQLESCSYMLDETNTDQCYPYPRNNMIGFVL
jgi:hypothetical protein